MDVYKKKTTRWLLDGKRVPAGTPGAVAVVEESPKWYGLVKGKHVPLSKDRTAAERILRKKLADLDLEAAGIVDPFGKHKARPLAEHLDDYQAVLTAKGSTAEHVTKTVERIRAVLDWCEMTALADLDPARVSIFLTDLRRDEAPIKVPPPPPKQKGFRPGEVAALFGISVTGLAGLAERHGIQATGNGKARRYSPEQVARLAKVRARGTGPTTVNHYVGALKGFSLSLIHI